MSATETSTLGEKPEARRADDLDPLHQLGDLRRGEGGLQPVARGPVPVALAGEQALAEQRAGTGHTAALAGDLGVGGQERPDLGRVPEEQQALGPDPDRRLVGAAGDQDVEHVGRGAPERPDQGHTRGQ